MSPGPTCMGCGAPRDLPPPLHGCPRCGRLALELWDPKEPLPPVLRVVSDTPERFAVELAKGTEKDPLWALPLIVVPFVVYLPFAFFQGLWPVLATLGAMVPVGALVLALRTIRKGHTTKIELAGGVLTGTYLAVFSMTGSVRIAELSDLQSHWYTTPKTGPVSQLMAMRTGGQPVILWYGLPDPKVVACVERLLRLRLFGAAG